MLGGTTFETASLSGFFRTAGRWHTIRFLESENAWQASEARSVFADLFGDVLAKRRSTEERNLQTFVLDCHSAPTTNGAYCFPLYEYYSKRRYCCEYSKTDVELCFPLHERITEIPVIPPKIKQILYCFHCLENTLVLEAVLP